MSVQIVKYNLLNISVLFVTSLIIIFQKNNFTVKDVEYVEWEEEKTFITAINAIAALGYTLKILISVLKMFFNNNVQFVWMIFSVQQNLSLL